jgi:prolyl-tRNA editing enzyme YbaK/EbsC (Cys-tRNA(Pro) deacylase)
MVALGFDVEVTHFPEGTRTAVEAARAVGCEVGQIAKSVVFRGSQSGRPVLVITSGANRVSESRVGEILGEPIVKADADFVREHTGFSIGGVPPVGHAERLETLIDQDLFRYQEIWAAAGTPESVCRLVPGDLIALTGGHPCEIASGT